MCAELPDAARAKEVWEQLGQCKDLNVARDLQMLTSPAAGYDELTHINQLMLGWVLEPGEDTRTILRLTAMKRTAGLDLSAPRVAATLDAMAARGVAIDPTAVTLELLMLSRDGAISPAVASYFDHLPTALQRRRRQGIARIESPAGVAVIVARPSGVRKFRSSPLKPRGASAKASCSVALSRQTTGGW